MSYFNANRTAMAPSPTPSHSKRIDKKKFTHVSSEEIARGEHMSLSKYKYVDASGTQKIWEVAERCHKTKNTDADSVCALPILHRMLKYDCLVLVKQYRPSVKAFTLELPAGIVESPETSSQQSALRRLNSQTGYTSTGVKQVSPLTASDPIHTTCTTKIVSVEINGDDLRNLNAQQKFAEGEFYEVVQIPMNDVLERLNDYSDEGYVIDSRVYTFAIGLSMGLKMGSERNGVKEDDVQFVTNIIDH
uniref:Putative nucleoside diphosphate-sugar hydrolase of the mutt nudix family n=1 Tax=Ixodes ricinus TaxID=34613 RepID=A0A131Y0B8_IXORI